LFGSPALDAIPVGSCTVSNDQRGISRPQGTACDIGAFESRGFSLTISGGNNQSTVVNTAFSQPLSVRLVAVETNMGVAGQVISFTAPGVGASLTQTLYTATTNSSGLASVVVAANSISGTYAVTATGQGFGLVSFSLNNSPINTSAIEIYLPLVFK
jgi:hypothetical protein